MRSVSAGLATHLSESATTLVTMWRIERKDGTVFRFTDHNTDLEYGGDTYASAIGYERSAVASNSSLAVGTTELKGMLDADSILASDLEAGLWDGAEVRIFAANWANLAQGEMKVLRGTLGEVTVNDLGTFEAELRSLADPLQQSIGSLYLATCKVDLGSTKCGINLAFGGGFTAADSVASAPDDVTLVLVGTGTSLLPDGWFDRGVAIWQTGLNAGVAREVIGWTQGTLTLDLLGPPPFAIAPGDTLYIQAGCDFLFATCKNKFNNKDNFRGFPLLPGANAVLDVPR